MVTALLTVALAVRRLIFQSIVTVVRCLCGFMLRARDAKEASIRSRNGRSLSNSSRGSRSRSRSVSPNVLNHERPETVNRHSMEAAKHTHSRPRADDTRGGRRSRGGQMPDWDTSTMPRSSAAARSVSRNRDETATGEAVRRQVRCQLVLPRARLPNGSTTVTICNLKRVSVCVNIGIP
jgi:hypothetical protein